MNIYLDESGDLGWTLDMGYRSGGSSRFLTISSLTIPKDKSQLTKRIVKKIYNRRGRGPQIEIKGKELSKGEKMLFAQKVTKLLSHHQDISISAITVKKENVLPHIRSDANKLYNYMIRLSLLDKICRFPIVNFIPDPRTIKVKSGNSLVDYLQIALWFEFNTATMIKNIPQESKRNLNLQFVDWVAHIIWKHYEDNESSAFNVLRRVTELKHLFF